MLVEVKYSPNVLRPFNVKKRGTNGWIELGDFADEHSAQAVAQRESKLPDLPYLVARFENGIKIYANDL